MVMYDEFFLLNNFHLHSCTYLFVFLHLMHGSQGFFLESRSMYNADLMVAWMHDDDGSLKC